MDRNYWKRYFDAETVARSDALRQEHRIMSTRVQIHMDVYLQPDRKAPTFIFNHGGGGYSRLFTPLALALYDRGYSVILPDQRGQGYSDGDRGDFTLGQCVQNIMDAAVWTRGQVLGALFMGGGSVGGGLTYKAAAAGAPVDAIICHNLYDFGSPHDSLAVSRLAPLADMPYVPAIFNALIQGAAAILPRVKIPFELLGKFNRMVDERDARFYPIWRSDPLPIKAVSLRYMCSTFTTPPAIPYEANTMPVLVINQTRDRMVSPSVTRRNYERLGGPKQYIEIDYGHWATGETFISEYVEIVDRFLREQMAVVGNR